MIKTDMSNSTILRGKHGNLYEIDVDVSRCRIWINYEDGSSVARFNTRTGIDIHNSITEQLSGKPQCLWCTHEKPSVNEWRSFREKVRDYYGIDLPDDAIDLSQLSRGEAQVHKS